MYQIIKPLSIFLLCFNIFMFAQKENVNMSVNYILKYKIDSTSDKYKKENFILFLRPDKSIYQSITTYVKDSLLSDKKNNETEIRKKYRTQNKYFIISDLKSQKISFYDELFTNQDKYYYTENLVNDWKLYSETKLLSNIKCQKAEIYKYGRKWIAWYTNEYAFPFGPYKFEGLPGLILEIYDEKKQYIFTAYKIKEEKNTQINFSFGSEYKKIEKEKFRELADKLKYDVYYKYKDLSFDDPNILRRMNENVKERKKKENNPIELSLE